MNPVLVVNPVSDDAFVGHVHRQANGVKSAETLQRILREHFPRAVVRERGLAAEQTVTWYVYREGVWVPSET